MALPPHPRFFYCPQWNETGFLGDYPQRGPFDSALIPARHLAPHPPGSAFHRRGHTGRELADCLAPHSTPFTVDPDTPALAAAGPAGLPTPRLATMPHAAVLPLPLSLLSFASHTDRVAFVQAALGAQAGAEMLVAPYFSFERRGDHWHQLNLELVADTAQVADRPVAAFAYAPTHALRAGEIDTAAPDYVDAGAEIVFLRVAGFDPQNADGDTIEAYRRALEAFADAGALVVAEAVGRFGLVVAGAIGAAFSSGSRHRQFTPAEPIYAPTDEMTSEKMTYEVPARWFGITHGQARRDQRAGLLPACPHAGCGALATGTGSAALTEHLVHYFTGAARAAAAAGASGVRASLRGAHSRAPSAWLRAA